MSPGFAHPERLLLALDEGLDHAVRLIIYGRSAIWLGFDNPPAAAATTKDVDAIIPIDQVDALAGDLQFWDSRDGVNERFKSEGLYITHLFSETEVFLRRDWLNHIVPITRLDVRWLKLFRPATIDLVLSKMMRGSDPQDMADAEFMIRHDRITEAQLDEAFAQMKPIELVELRDAFAHAKPIVLQLAARLRTVSGRRPVLGMAWPRSAPSARWRRRLSKGFTEAYSGAVNEPPRISEAPARVVPIEVLPPEPPPSAAHEPTAGGPPIHAAAALLLLIVDNLWNLADWMVIDWIITIPLSFLTVFVPVFFIQKLLKKQSVGKALAYALLLGVIAAVPFSVTGSTVGVALLAWLGISKLIGRPLAK